MRKITKIYIHHSALPPEVGVEGIRKLHKSKGFKEVGYHFVIDSQGVIHLTRKIEEIGAHVKGDNECSIGICLCGNFETTLPKEVQVESLKTLIKRLIKKLGRLEIQGHKEYEKSDTLCPGKNLMLLLPQIKKEVYNGL
jgi:N-acetyl-anhydromuramyl-L-alanine amidase AmpD